mgnify:CR=1 FL=1
MTAYPGRRGRRGRLVAVAAVIGLAVAAVLATRARFPRPPAVRGHAAYQCAMHPEIVSHEAGTCPICGMKLQRVEADGGGPADAKILFYRHPMRPDVTSPTPAKDEMGMDYVPVREDDVGGPAGDVPGHAPFALSPARQQLIGVTRARVERRALAVEIRAVGKVARDPQLYQAIVEYREALRARGQIKDSPWLEAHEGAQAIVRAAALRLRQQGLSEEQIGAIGRDAPNPTNLLLPGASVWIYAQVYEYESELVHPGQEMVVTALSLPGRSFATRIAAVDPMLDVTSRTLRVRALVETPEGNLRPETFVEARIQVPLGEQLAVPRDAVLDTGARQIVFVVKGAGSFEPRAVQLGRDAPPYAEVLGGLTAGEEVVTSANFLIDSESRFRAALAAFGAPPGH